MSPRTQSTSTSLGRQFSWTLPANVIYGFSNFFLLMVLNKWAASDEAGIAAAGRFNWALALTSPLFMFANLRFRTVIATDAHGRFKLRDFFQLRAILLVAVIIVAGLMATWLAMQGESGKAFLVAAVGAAKVVEGLSDICCGLQQRVERMDRIAVSMIGHGVGMISAFAIIYVLTSNLVFAATGLLLARIVAFFAFDVPMAKEAASELDAQRPAASPGRAGDPISNISSRERMWSLLFLAAPLGFTAMLVSLTSNIPKYIIPEIFDESMLGVYASLAMTIQAGNLIFRAVEMPVMPRLGKHISNNNEKAFWMLLGQVVLLFVGLAVVGSGIAFVFGGSILSFVFNPAYASMGGLFALVIACTAVAQVTGIVELSMIPARLTAVQLPLHTVTVGLCLVLSLVLIPRYEVAGALLAVTVCRFPFLLAGVWFLRRRLRYGETKPTASASNTEESKDGIRDAA